MIPRKVVAVRREKSVWVLKLECGHTICSSVRRHRGDLHDCFDCVDEAGRKPVAAADPPKQEKTRTQ